MKRFDAMMNEEGKVVIFDNDFTHDATFTITGDFKSDSQKVAYARDIADKLNKYESMKDYVITMYRNL